MFKPDITRQTHSRTTRRIFLATGIAAAAATWLAIRQSPAVQANGAVHGTPGQVTLVNFSNDGKNLGKQTVPKIVKSDAEWLRQLGRNSFGIARQADTEMPFSGVTWNEHARGIFRCIGCETALFSSQTKFDSGTGWPSFWAPLAKENVREITDRSLGMDRTEVQCARCEGHLGHVFNDGPHPQASATA